ELYQRWDRQRHEAMLDGPIRNFVAKQVLRPDISPEEGADIVWLLIDPGVYDRLVNECGWSTERFEGWLAETMTAQLLVPRRKRKAATTAARAQAAVTRRVDPVTR